MNYFLLLPFLIKLIFSFLSPSSPPTDVSVQILGLNDFHGQLNTTSALHDKAVGRADYISAYIQSYRDKNPNTLLVHTGDMIGGSPPISALFHDEPTMEFLNNLQFDVGTIGNHEFDRGPIALQQLINGESVTQTSSFSGSSFPYISANIVYSETNQSLFLPYIIKWIDGIPIAFIGVSTNDTPLLTMYNDMSSIRFLDEASSINLYVYQLQKKGIHAFVILAHLGGNTTESNTNGPLADLANQIDPDVDIIFGGHTHSYINGNVNGKLLVQAYSYGKAFSNVTFTLNRKTKDITKKAATIVPVYQNAISPDFHTRNWIDSYASKIQSKVEEQLGITDHELTRNQNEHGQSNLGTVLAIAQCQTMQADIAFVNPGSIRHNLKKGTITWEDTFLIQPFGNKLIKMYLSGKEIRNVLQEQWKEETRMLQISGIRYSWKNNIIQTISLDDGTPLRDDQIYSVVVNSFLANGGDKFLTFKEGRNRSEGPTDQEAFANFIRSISHIDTLPQNFLQKIY
ncbi:bifunctional metallophosphatase/5'-nucleotidase [Bacillus pseudomycoides]|uniref:bifunctional metallophosphatase/5'-nucleotidase n=1 Tax=Bacillus pseudomycoides TaxID=64104 RepID=UPI000BF18FAD|nr:bifunctional metallophosphatase/5'-nucleotidase [Bacillus pseudomycoides]PEJ39228.1 bifunctional metallophosphatase/5'-nucleotidase [Bacillus pseudomycoides]PHA96624.1 bifunctional metallophosphatase/5'-nucleotidase [Bacillus pseudomycoides]PHC79470.1 bifunctional metallophosphatase/5'-nucleotidase [Bacillus pseudomycoides]